MRATFSLSRVYQRASLFAARESVKNKAFNVDPQAQRLVSLDAFRGFVMLCIIGDYAVVRGLESLKGYPIAAIVVRQLTHSPWRGLRFEDVIWPSFMLMVGVSAVFSYAKRSKTQTNQQMMWAVAKRAAILFILGSVRESVALGAPALIERSSALQSIALASVVCFLLAPRSWRTQALVGGIILGGHALLLAFVPAPGIPPGSYQKGANLVYAVDMAVLGRVYTEGWGTVLAEIPAVATSIIGMLIGGLLKSTSVANKHRAIAAIGVACLAIGWSLGAFIPVIMKMWTASYGLVSAGWACLLFLLFYFIFDELGLQKWSFPLVVVGMNAITIYMLGESDTLISFPKIVDIYTKRLASGMGSFGLLFQALAILTVEWLVLYWMYKRKIFLKA